MIQDPSKPENVYYEVGAVAKISGISPHTIRTWERRGFLQAERRSATGRRQYSKQQLERLILLSKLTAEGDSISAISNLSIQELRVRITDYDHPNLAADIFNPAKILKLYAIEKRTFMRLDRMSSRVSKMLLDLNSIEDINDSDRPDLVAMEAPPSIDGLNRIVEMVSGKWPDIPIVLFYDFLSREQLRRLGNEGFFLIRLPIPNEQLEQYLFKAAGEKRVPKDIILQNPEHKKDAERLFSKSQLIALANSSPKLKCECPNHMAALVSSLMMFEDYCHNCEVDSPADERLHKHLGYEVSVARRRVEEALMYLFEADGLPIPPRETVV
ncbi:MAG: MerR family transcriptional regulator [Verrucomicrobia bacterium]|nr:MerR family transcriptional regulator [Verrucomicrobiota bacterium]